MTARAYYTDATTHQFLALITAVNPVPDRPSLVDVTLSTSYFYPTSGGQPHDIGTLDELPVVDVFVDPQTKAIVHRVADPSRRLTADSSRPAAIDWPRRFDHMQHHTGQHILSQAFVELADADTVGFHLGTDSCTIDLNQVDLSEDLILAAERRANEIIFENRPVAIRFVTQQEADQLPLRKRPEVDGEQVRLVDIVDFDLNACGGTHVQHTGQVGLLKINKVERRKDKLRVEFRCGWRAIDHYQQQQQIIQTLMGQFTTAADALPAVTEGLQEERKTLQREVRGLQKELQAVRAAQLADRFQRLPLAGTEIEAAVMVHLVEPEMTMPDLQQLVAQLIDTPDRIGFFGHPEGFVLLKKGDQLPGHLGNLLKAIIVHEGHGSGGGGPHQAQGKLHAAAAADLSQLLAQLQQRYLASVARADTGTA